MQEIAREVYRRASRKFHDDYRLSSFLNNLVEDEARHSHIMNNASEFLQKNGDTKRPCEKMEENSYRRKSR